jgi:hypothetical protein
MVVRRLIASLVVLACLLGIVRPAIDCSNCVSRTDCCPAGSATDCGAQIRSASHCAQATHCCALRATVAPSLSLIGVRVPQGHASGFPAATLLATMPTVGRPLLNLRTPVAFIPIHVDESLTYLRTARLRL